MTLLPYPVLMVIPLPILQTLSAAFISAQLVSPTSSALITLSNSYLANFSPNECSFRDLSGLLRGALGQLALCGTLLISGAFVFRHMLLEVELCCCGSYAAKFKTRVIKLSIFSSTTYLSSSQANSYISTIHFHLSDSFPDSLPFIMFDVMHHPSR